jgi:hypothetical protein
MTLPYSPENPSSKLPAFSDDFEAPDFYQIDDLFTDE